MIGNSAHRYRIWRIFLPRRECDLQLARTNHCVFVEHLVKIAQPKEKYGAGIHLFYLEILPKHRRCIVHDRGRLNREIQSLAKTLDLSKPCGFNSPADLLRFFIATVCKGSILLRIRGPDRMDRDFHPSLMRRTIAFSIVVNKAMKYYVIVALLIAWACALASGQTSPPSASVSPTAGQALPVDKDDRYRIGLQDTLEVQVFRHSELNRRVNVNPNGTISLFRLDEPIVAVCKTEDELAQDIEKAYAKDYLRDPQV